MKKINILIFIMLIFAFILTGCSGSKASGVTEGVKVNKEDENTDSNTFTNFNDAKKAADDSNLRGIKVYDINGDIVYEPDNLYLKSKAYKSNKVYS